MIPQSFIDDLLYRLDIADVVGRYVPLKHAGVNLQGLCPFHKEKSPSFSVSPAKQFYHCFGCGASGNAIGFVIEHLGLTFPEAVEHLAGSLGLEVPHEQGDLIPEAVLSERDHLIQLLTQAAAWYKSQLKRSQEAVNYLKTRGLTGEVAARYGLGYAPDHYHNLKAIVPVYDNTPLLDTAGLTKGTEEGGRRYDRFRARIMFPIRNGKGQVIGFGGRVLGQGEPKYLNSPETPVFSKGQEVYGLFEARQPIHKMGYALVTEGYMDVVALAQWGFENAVATLGTAVTPEHVQKLFKQTDRLVFAFDGDTAGQKAAWRALQACLSHINEHKRADFMFFPAEHDPDSFIRTEGPEGFLALLAQALSLTEFLSKHVEQQFPLHQMEGRAAAIAFLKPLVHQMQQTVLRASVIRGLAELLACTPAELSQHLSVKTQISKGEYFSPRGKKDKFGRADGPPRHMTPRPQAKSPLLSLAARLVKMPHLAHECNELVALYEREQKPQNEVHSFMHLLAQVKKDPNLLEARLQHVFNDAVHQDWVNAVLKEARGLDEAMNLEVELKAAVHHCSEVWFKTELQRLSEKLSTEPETIKIYQECMIRYQELKQKRVNQL